MFGFWDWVGGRYSMDSAIGLSLMLADRPGRASASCSPASTPMDEHFRTAPLERNLPVLLGLLGVWYADFFGAADATRCCPTTSTCALRRPTCSSSTWRATASRSASTARRVDYATGPIVWGEPGTNGQHAFYQLLHQGTRLIPADFIGFAAPRATRRRRTTTC